MISPVALPRGRLLEFGRGFVIMGIVNATPDSFFPGSRRNSVSEIRDAALAMEAAGAGVIDIGGESTRPGAAAVSLDEELERVVPAIEALRRCSDIPVSVDTRKPEVARLALAAGADIVNDITALGDKEMARIASASGAAVILMHMRGEPATMQDKPFYADCLAEVSEYLSAAAARAIAAGIPADRIILDPGIGFGKRGADNLALLGGLDRIAALGYPVLVGLSRKRFIGEITGRAVDERLAGSLGAASACLARGAAIFRVHDVAATLDALATFRACYNGGKSEGGPE